MWYVYNVEDSWEHGFVVATRGEAERICREDESKTYSYVER